MKTARTEDPFGFYKQPPRKSHYRSDQTDVTAFALPVPRGYRGLDPRVAQALAVPPPQLRTGRRRSGQRLDIQRHTSGQCFSREGRSANRPTERPARARHNHHRTPARCAFHQRPHRRHVLRRLEGVSSPVGHRRLEAVRAGRHDRYDGPLHLGHGTLDLPRLLRLSGRGVVEIASVERSVERKS